MGKACYHTDNGSSEGCDGAETALTTKTAKTWCSPSLWLRCLPHSATRVSPGDAASANPGATS